MFFHRPLLHRFDSDYAYDHALAREEKRSREPGMYSRAEFDRIARTFSYWSSLNLAHDLAMEEDARWEREKFDKQHERDNEIL